MPSFQSFLWFISCASLSYFEAKYLHAPQPKEISIIEECEQRSIKIIRGMNIWEVCIFPDLGKIPTQVVAATLVWLAETPSYLFRRLLSKEHTLCL